MTRILIHFLILVCVAGGLVRPAQAASADYVVRKGDTLYSIARRLDLSVAELKRLNGMSTDDIYPGMRLRTGSVGLPKEIVVPNGPYYGQAPRSDVQKNLRYTEPAKSSPRDDFGRAEGLMAAYKADLRERYHGKGKKPLAGWRVVVDPGHGGVDPGAIVSNFDGRDREVFVVEDEYVYDIAMRVMEGLVAAGAEVELTVISPNHTKRDNFPALYTFVNEQNEVYNDARINGTQDGSVRPLLNNISQRVRIANRFFQGGRKGKRLFVSLHADNSPGRPKGPLVIYHERRGRADRASRRLADAIRNAMDRPSLKSQIGGRNLAVLRNNHADAEVLVEIRNVSIKDDAYALRFHERRQEDAELVVKGIVDYAKRR